MNSGASFAIEGGSWPFDGSRLAEVLERDCGMVSYSVLFSILIEVVIPRT